MSHERETNANRRSNNTRVMCITVFPVNVIIGGAGDLFRRRTYTASPSTGIINPDQMRKNGTERKNGSVRRREGRLTSRMRTDEKDRTNIKRIEKTAAICRSRRASYPLDPPPADNNELFTLFIVPERKPINRVSA